MAYTQEQLDRLRAAYASGALEVQMGDERIRYATRQDLAARIREIEASLGVGRRRPSSRLATFARGDR
jgi:hypothetical protein